MEKTSSKVERKHALVVVGGSMRAIFSTGVLDYFLENDFRSFNFCIGVSAGSTNIAAWLANQHGRNYKVFTDYSCRPQFISFKKFLFGGHWFNLDWLWDITIKEIRIDLKTFASQKTPLYIVTTNVLTGKAEYILATANNLEDIMKASCALPFIYRKELTIGGVKMIDGGISDPIPAIKAYHLGAKEITVILSRPRGYRKKPPQSKWMVRKFFSKTPLLAEAIIQHANNYNNAIDFIEHPPQDCIIHIIAPPDDFPVNRMTKNKKILNTGYQMGKDVAAIQVKSM